MKAKTVKMEVGYRLARIRPGNVGQLLASDLSYASTDFVPGGAFGYQVQTRRPLLFKFNDEGALLVPTGLVPLVRDRLMQRGFRVEVNDNRCFFPADPSVVSTATPKDFLETIAREPRGLLEVRTGQDVIQRTALICKLFPKAKIAMFLASRKEMRSFRRQLQTCANERIHTFKSYDWPWEGGRVVLSTKDLRRLGGHLRNDFDIIILANILQTCGAKHLKAIYELSGRRLYGFTRQHAAIGARTRMQLQAYLGPVIYRVPDPRGKMAQARVLWCQPPWSPPVGDVTALERKRFAVWHNDKRNDLIAAVADAFAAGDKERLWERGLLLAEEDSGFISGTGVPGVTILVESSEHGRELLRRLPGWELEHLVPGTGGREANGSVSPFKIRPLDKVIITYTATTKLESMDTDALIVAGPEWPLEIRGFPPRSQEPAREVMIIDMADDIDNIAQAATRRRLRDYTARVWTSSSTPAWMLQDGDG